MYRRETVVSRPWLIAAIHFEMIEKLSQQSDIEIFYLYSDGRRFKRSEANRSNSRKASRYAAIVCGLAPSCLRSRSVKKH
jgi:hypothetical protein